MDDLPTTWGIRRALDEENTALRSRVRELEGRLRDAHRRLLRIDALTDNTVMPGDPSDLRDLWVGLRALLAGTTRLEDESGNDAATEGT